MDFETLRKNCLDCRKCGLCETRTNVVFGTGNRACGVMFIGEGPGQREDERGFLCGTFRPIIGSIPQRDSFKPRENIFHHQYRQMPVPAEPRSLPNEWDACIPLSPGAVPTDSTLKIVVCLGRCCPAYYRPDFSVMKSMEPGPKKTGPFYSHTAPCCTASEAQEQAACFCRLCFHS